MFKLSINRYKFDNFYYQFISIRTSLILYAVVFQLTLASNIIEFICSNQDEFFYAVPGSRCTSYYKCNRNGTRDTYDCIPGAKFDFYKQTCTRTEGICYEPICVGRIDGVYQDTTHACRRTFSCKAGYIKSFDNCPYGKLHNGHGCIEQEFVVCELPQTTAIAYPFSGDKRCFGKKNGCHVADNDNCNRYIICKNEEVIDDINCPYGYRFHPIIERCLPSNEVHQCNGNQNNINGGTNRNQVVTIKKNYCHGLKDGYHPDPESLTCKTYIKCLNNQFISMDYCGEQAIFNGIACVPLPLYQCPLTNKLDLCRKTTNGFLSNPIKGCQSYVKCIDKKTVEHFDCLAGQYFDPNVQNCVYEKFLENRYCKNIEESFECTQLEAGYYQDKSPESLCRKYYFCYNGNRTNFQCKIGYNFNGESCVPANTYLCPSLDPNSCVAKSNGYYKDSSAGCRSYYYCSNGQKFSYICNENQLFNGDKCVPRNSPSDQQFCKQKNLCTNKHDGYYPDFTSNCRNYYYCLNEEMIITIPCRGNNIYNGIKCVNPEAFTCTKKLMEIDNDDGSADEADDDDDDDSDGNDAGDGHGNGVNDIANRYDYQYRRNSIIINKNCIPRSCEQQQEICKNNGFFADYDTNCQNYYFCIGNRKSSILTCSDGYAFNGDLCVPYEQFSCPKYCTEQCSHKSN